VRVENSDDDLEMGPQPNPNPFSPFRPGPGRPTLRRDYLLNHRENLLCLIEPHWYELEWKLRRARKPEQVHLAFQIDAFKLNPGPLAPLLRARFEFATRKDLEITRKRLGDAVRKARSVSEKYQAQAQSYEDARRVSFVLSEDFKEQLRGDLERRRKYIGKLKGWSAKIKAKIRECELENKTRITPSAARSAAIAALQKCMHRLERDRTADEKVCDDLEARMRPITPDARKLAIDDEARQKSLLDSLEADSKSTEKELRAIETTFADQEAFVYQTEILDFVRKREYALIPLRLANAIAGLPYIRARRSAQRCSRMKSRIRRSTTYELFEFVTGVWKRHRKKRQSSLIEVFKRAIRKLPKFEIVEGHKRSTWFRAHLAKNWYYLKRALQEPEHAKLHPRAVPGAIVRHFLTNMQNPESPITPKLAEIERIQD
jgi:hypothetical protein